MLADAPRQDLVAGELAFERHDLVTAPAFVFAAALELAQGQRGFSAAGDDFIEIDVGLLVTP
ncbi:MAG: hypothetical protein B7Y80_15625 [Hyphomicrobium sp. 32-62-53]|nr:MAG: hypothetical protein B7Z29_14850 [Hyphomicrobium sp. 12-62-95]OYX98455.1 MAG: hypothetical protein B7Y80_15625 [Hyphomicrobium sp. 32-62-53]